MEPDFVDRHEKPYYDNATTIRFSPELWLFSGVDNAISPDSMLLEIGLWFALRLSCKKMRSHVIVCFAGS